MDRPVKGSKFRLLLNCTHLLEPSKLKTQGRKSNASTDFDQVEQVAHDQRTMTQNSARLINFQVNKQSKG
jgi:hypothetical protein